MSESKNFKEPMSVSLDPAWKAILKPELKARGFRSLSEYFRSLIIADCAAIREIAQKPVVTLVEPVLPEVRVQKAKAVKKAFRVAKPVKTATVIAPEVEEPAPVKKSKKALEPVVAKAPVVVIESEIVSEEDTHLFD